MVSTRKNKKKWIWWGGGIAIVIALVVTVGIVVAINNSGENADEAETSEVSKENEEVNESQKSDEELINEQGEKQKVVQYEGDDPNNSEELTGVVTYAGVTDGTLMVRMSIDQYLTEGICELTLTRSGNIIYSDKADIVGDVSTAMCMGFDVPVADLGEGSIEITINLSADGKTGVVRGEANI